ncbi:MAG TPA: RES family NAD+ phosphorylase [Saprospiraceae bacterium]|nr:RES family NAD+ phosphorylase [Saprospiraceae bacterium]
MELFRIARDNYIHDLSGTGAKIYGGRWNRPGVPVLYTSQARSLALLELIVHFRSSHAFALPYSFAVIKTDPSLIEPFDASNLPENWIQLHQEILWKWTEYYFYEKNVCIVKVPSVLVKGEYNFLINPLHSLFSDNVIIKHIEDALLDKRYQAIIART